MQQGQCIMYLGSSLAEASAIHDFLCQKIEHGDPIKSGPNEEEPRLIFKIEKVICEFDGIQHRIIAEGVFRNIGKPFADISFEFEKIGESHEE